MIRKSKVSTFEWTCNRCNYIHMENYSSIKAENGLIEIACSQCGSIRQLKLVELPEAGLAGDWISTKCRQCTERQDCICDDKSIFDKRVRFIRKLGFCEDYIVDNSQLPTNPQQVCHEERTFGELFNRGRLPIYKDERI